MYNLLEYGDNYSVTSISLWNYYRDEVNYYANENNDAGNYRINNSKTTTTSKSFEYKTNIIETAPDNNSRLDTEVFVPLNYLRRSLDLPLINCEMDLELSWSRNCVIPEVSRTPEFKNSGANSPFLTREATLTIGGTFQINSATLYVPVVIFSINDNINFLKHLKQGIRRAIS